MICFLFVSFVLVYSFVIVCLWCSSVFVLDLRLCILMTLVLYSLHVCLNNTEQQQQQQQRTHMGQFTIIALDMSRFWLYR